METAVSQAPAMPPGFEIESQGPPAVSAAAPAIPAGFEIEAPSGQAGAGSSVPSAPLPAVSPAGGLPHPDVVDALTTQHANTLAGIVLTRAQMEASAPLAPAPPIPYGLQSDQQQIAGAPTFQNPRTGRIYPRQAPGKEGGPLGVLDKPMTGPPHVAEGVEEMTRPGARAKAGGLHKAIGGVLETATPLMVGAGVAAPAATAATFVAGTGAQRGAEWALKKVGIPEEYAAVAGDLVGLFAAAKTPKTISALRAKYEPVLRARFEKAKADAPDNAEPAGNSTGTAPYRPPAVPAGFEVEKPGGNAVESAVDARKRLRTEKYSEYQARMAALDQKGTAGTVASEPAKPAAANPVKIGQGEPSGPAAGRTVREGRAVSETPAGVRGPGTGHETSVLIPGTRTEHPATYRLRELADVKASHHAFSFQEDPDYPYTNDRDYTKLENQQRVILQAQEFNPRYLVNDNPTASDGPPVVDEDGHTIGGNSRVMTLHRVYAQHPEAQAAYRGRLAEHAAHYGIDPSEVASMRQPALVREVSPGAAEQVQRAITDMNKVGTAALGPSEQALVDSKRVSPETLEAVQHYIAKLGQKGSLARALASEDGPDVVNRLVDDGVITDRDRPQYIAEGRVTPEGKTRIGRLLIGRMFADVKQFDETPAGMRNKVERIVAPLARLEGRPEWDASMNRDIREALRVLHDAGSRGFTKLEDLDSQQSIVGKTKYPPDAYRWAYVLKNNSMGALTKAFRSYVEIEGRSRPGTVPDMFGPPPVPQGEAFAQTIGKLKDVGRRVDVKEPPAAPPVDKPVDETSAAEPVKPAASAVAADKTPAASTAGPEPAPHGPVTLGSGLGAFEPFFRESIEDMRAMKAKRDAAIAELKRSEITPGEKNWGAQVRHFFTGERDLWGARANQGIAKVRKVLGVAKDKRGVDSNAVVASIAREFKKRPEELKAFIDGTHPALLGINDLFQAKRVEARLAAIRPQMQRAYRQLVGGPSKGARVADRFYTNMATVTAAEGRKTGVLETQWDPDTYVPHVLHPKGEGEYPGLKKAAGRVLGGQIGKHFGYAERRNYPTLLHAIVDDVIPKTMDIHDAFTIQQDHFARARATRLLEQQLKDSNIGVYAVRRNAPDGWVQLAPHSTEFHESVPYDTGRIDNQGNAILENAEKHLYVPKFIEQALKPITAPDATLEIRGFQAARVTQAATKAAQLGLSLFHATTENYMALANMGVRGYVRALRVSRDSADFGIGERTFIRAGGTTSIQGNTVEAYRAMQPGSIPTYHDIWRQNAAVKIMDQAAQAITDFTFANMQRRFKVTDFMLHRAAWMAEHPNATAAQLEIAEQGMAKEVNAVYGGLHWENLGVNRASVELARAVFLAPDWTISNIFNVRYAFEGGLKGAARQVPGLGRLAPKSWEGPAAGNMARAFWARTLVGGLVATQAASLMFSGQFSKRYTMVYMGHDVNGEEIYQNIFFKGAPGDAVNLVNNVRDYGLEGIARTMAGKEAPLLRTFAMLQGGRDYLGHEIAPKDMSWFAKGVRTSWAVGKSLSPVPFSFANQIDMLFGPEAHRYTMPEMLTTLFAGNPPAHVPPAGTHMSGGILRPNAEREENSAWEQMETGEVYKRRAR